MFAKEPREARSDAALRLNGSAGGDGRLSGWELYGYDRRGTTIHELESIGGEVADIVDNKN